MLLQNSLNEKLSKKGNRRRRKYLMNPPPATAGCLARTAHKVLSMVRWVFDDFLLGHLVWIKLIFLFQSASMTVLYPYINLHMKVNGAEISHFFRMRNISVQGVDFSRIFRFGDCFSLGCHLP